jgi:hypothetical protein
MLAAPLSVSRVCIPESPTSRHAGTHGAECVSRGRAERPGQPPLASQREWRGDERGAGALAREAVVLSRSGSVEKLRHLLKGGGLKQFLCCA